MIEFVAIDHDDVSAGKATDFDVGPHADDLELLGPFGAGMIFLHLHDVVQAVAYHGWSSILIAAGTFGRPGIVMTLPVKTTTKFAPAERLHSRTVMVKPRGAPMIFGSSVMEFGVFAMQI